MIPAIAYNSGNIQVKLNGITKGCGGLKLNRTITGIEINLGGAN
jgi:hypothetical protein